MEDVKNRCGDHYIPLDKVTLDYDANYRWRGLSEEDIENMLKGPGEIGESFARLVDSIKVSGVLVPIEAVAYDDGTYKVVTGNHRVLAAVEAGLTHIPALLLDDEPSYDERLIRQMSENADETRVPTTHGQKVEAFKVLLYRSGDDGSDSHVFAKSCEVIGWTKINAVKFIKEYNTYPTPIRDLLRRGVISGATARAVFYSPGEARVDAQGKKMKPVPVCTYSAKEVDKIIVTAREEACMVNPKTNKAVGNPNHLTVALFGDALNKLGFKTTVPVSSGHPTQTAQKGKMPKSHDGNARSKKVAVSGEHDTAESAHNADKPDLERMLTLAETEKMIAHLVASYLHNQYPSKPARIIHRAQERLQSELWELFRLTVDDYFTDKDESEE